LKALYPTARVKATGHSLGAALATLTAMELVKYYPDVQLYNYGSPRVGTKAFSDFAGSKMTDAWRVTHLRDPVPHLAEMWLDYYHICTEEYEDAFGNIHSCNSTCEDPTCADQWATWQYRGPDHLVYLGITLCDPGSGCQVQCVLNDADFLI
jgi:hypothetical protein